MANQGEGPAIRIDLATTYSCVAVWQHERVEIIVNDQGNRTTPSYVAFTPKERLVGDAAKNQVARNPTNSVFGNLQRTVSFFFFLKMNKMILFWYLDAGFAVFTYQHNVNGNKVSEDHFCCLFWTVCNQ